MKRFTLLALCLALAACLLTSCESDSPVSPAEPADKIVDMDGGGGGGGDGSGEDPPEEDPTFETQVVKAYQSNVVMKSISVTMDLAGDYAIVAVPGYTQPFTFLMLANSGLTGPVTFQVRYADTLAPGVTDPEIPGDVTLYEFEGLPQGAPLGFRLPPAFWYPEGHLGLKCSVYSIDYEGDEWAKTEQPVQTIIDYTPMNCVFVIDDLTGPWYKPDSPKNTVLDPDDPGPPNDPGEGDDEGNP